MRIKLNDWLLYAQELQVYEYFDHKKENIWIPSLW